jgi:glutathione peroxidase
LLSASARVYTIAQGGGIHKSLSRQRLTAMCFAPTDGVVLSDMISRRSALSLAATALAAGMLGRRAQAQSSGPAVTKANMSQVSAHAFAFKALDGSDIRLADYAGKPILIVNTASLCGYTPQFTGLQELWQRYHARGLMVIGVPSNDFGGQEPGGKAEIEATAHEYHVTFPLTAKAVVKGIDAHPFYRWALLQRPGEAPRWNFHKYLIDRDGGLKAGYATTIEPTDPRIIVAIERELAAD